MRFWWDESDIMENDESDACAQEKAVSSVFPELFHYTSMFSLGAILESKSIWATQLTHLNDTTEAEVIWPRIREQVQINYREATEQRIQSNPDIKKKIQKLGGLDHVATAEADTLTAVMRSQLLGSDTDPSTRSVAPPFVCSFTTHGGDSDADRYHRKHGMLSQWRGYGGSESVAIVFDTKKLETMLEREYSRFDYLYCFLADVVYDSEDQLLLDGFPNLADALSTYTNAMVGFDIYTALMTLSDGILREFPIAAGRLKHGAFREERECRIVVGPLLESAQRKEVGSATTGQEQAAKTILHRAGHSSPIPYLSLFEQFGEELPITRIIVGPSRNQLVHVETVRDLVKASQVDVQASAIPFVASV